MSLGLVASCGVDEPDLGAVQSAATATVSSYETSTCSTAVVIGLSKQIADEVGCMNPTSLVPFAAGSGITITSNSVLPYLAANAKTDLMAVGDVQINSAFRTVAQQYLLYRWYQLGRCGIPIAATVGTSNHESGRAVDVANYSSRITAMGNHGWAHDVSGDPVHFDHLSSADIRGKDTLAFQKLWNKNNPGDQISEDGAYGPQTEARLKSSPATGFAIGASCNSPTHGLDVVSIDGPDKVAPGAKAHYTLTVKNTGTADWPATTKLVVKDGSSELFDAGSWTSDMEVGPIDTATAAGKQATIAFDIQAPQVTTETAEMTIFSLADGATEFGTITLAVTVTPNGDEGTSGDSGDTMDGGGGCSSTRGGSGWLVLGIGLAAVRRRRR